jgi:sugar lactone lactonase YvrE
MFGGLDVRRDLLCVGHSDSKGRVFVVDLKDKLIKNAWIFSGDQEFADAGGLCIDSYGHVLVADAHNDLVRRFTLFGKEVGRIGKPQPGKARLAYVDENGYLEKPNDVAVDAQDQIYVACGDRALVHGVQRFDKQGGASRSFRAFGEPNEKFGAPLGIALGANRLFVADTFNGCVQTFRKEGRFIGMFSTATFPGEVSQPTAVAVLPGDRLAVAQWKEPSVVKCFDLSGTFVSTLIQGGEGKGSVHEPTGLVVDERARLFVLDRDGERVQMFDPAGNLIEEVIDLRKVLFHDP